MVISITLMEQIRADVAADPSRERCGLLLGRGGRIEAVLPAANVADDPARRFEIDPATLLDAHRAARAGGAAVVGHYHSHPGGPAQPSARDAAAAHGDGALWMIAGRDAVRLFAAVQRGRILGAFEPVDLRVAGRG